MNQVKFIKSMHKIFLVQIHQYNYNVFKKQLVFVVIKHKAEKHNKKVKKKLNLPI